MEQGERDGHMRIPVYKTIFDKTNDNKPILVKEKGFLYQTSDTGLCSPKQIVDMMQSVFRLELEMEEHVYMLAFSSPMKVLGIFHISKGTANASLLSPREIYLKSLIIGASQIIICHNHPGGSKIPSKEDIQVTKRIREVGDLIGIKLQDHIILGENSSYTSLKEEGLL